MSGHSKWSTIKRQKEINDQVKGKIFTKLSLAISVAVKTGGGEDPETNPKLRAAIEAARSANMPKENIEKAINKAKEKGNLEEVIYEGFGPSGIGVLVEVATDNKNRTFQEIRNIFEKNEGNMATPGAVSYDFKQFGIIVVAKSENPDEQVLLLIDSGADDIQDVGHGFELLVLFENINLVRNFLSQNNQKIISIDIVRKANNPIKILDLKVCDKIKQLLNALEEHDDVQKVFTNALI
ncbi:MAG: YebC/PmpR family DNA-binding transcriptional regulator [Patescibacteria group bacterium]|nr:YebC/PmpR family DNA-binding transcriptional regulator [Patescibacteria group bacterium]